MTDLYTVRYRKKSIITRIDGRVKTTTETWIEEVHHDLPYQTALMYRNTMAAENQCSIEKQSPSQDFKHKSRVRFPDEERSARPASKSSPAPKKPVEREKARVDGYAAVVNSMMEEA